MKVSFVLMFISLVVCVSSENTIKSVFGAIFGSSPASLEPPEERLCTGCSQKNEVVGDASGNMAFTITEKQLTALRIEYIKNQILKKLRLKQKPQVFMADLPEPVIEDESLVPGQEYAQDTYLDDFFGRTTFSVIFPYEGE